MATLSTDDFFYSKEQKLFTADMSTLDQGRTRLVFQRVFQDAIDVGFIMISHHTGMEVTFVVNKVDGGDEDHDGEIMGWHLVPTKESIRKNPRCEGMKVLIVNT